MVLSGPLILGLVSQVLPDLNRPSEWGPEFTVEPPDSAPADSCPPQ